MSAVELELIAGVFFLPIALIMCRRRNGSGRAEAVGHLSLREQVAYEAKCGSSDKDKAIPQKDLGIVLDGNAQADDKNGEERQSDHDVSPI